MTNRRKGKIIVEFSGSEVLERKVTKFGTGAHVIVPKEHIGSLADVNSNHDKVMAHIMRLLPKLAQEQGLERGFRTIINTGPGGGQEVYHLHFHLLGGDSLPGFA